METKEKIKIDRIIIIALLVVIIGLITGIGYLTLVANETPDWGKIFRTNGKSTISMDEFLVNLRSEDKEDNYLKVNLALMFTDEKTTDEVNSNISKIRDLIIVNLRKRTKEELLEKTGVDNLKADIKEDINTSFEKITIDDVYITDIIVQ